MKDPQILIIKIQEPGKDTSKISIETNMNKLEILGALQYCQAKTLNQIEKSNHSQQ